MTRTERLLMKLGKMDAPFGIEISPPENEDEDWHVTVFMISSTGITLQEALEEALEQAKEHPERIPKRNRSKKRMSHAT